MTIFIFNQIAHEIRQLNKLKNEEYFEVKNLISFTNQLYIKNNSFNGFGLKTETS